MKLPPALDALLVKFDKLSLRERLLVSAAVLVGVVMAWQATVMDPLTSREKALSAELTELQETVSRTSRATATVASLDPTTIAMNRLAEQQKSLDVINAKLAAESAGLVPPAQMIEVIHDVLRHQRGLTLVSLRNREVVPLAPPEPPKPALEGNSPENAPESIPEKVIQGPYLHPVELVVEGRYLDVVAYLRELEGLPWHFYWRVLELETKSYPMNRVRIELSTVSLDKEWIGV